jgi:predicted homoserine dehydrogenase-like protein
MEQACVANATGMKVAVRGMYGYEHNGHINDMASMYDYEQMKALGGIIEYAVGAQPGPGVFVYATTTDPLNKHHLKYYKLGEGPLYSFYTPYHLCIFEVPTSIARVVDFRDYVLKPIGGPVVEVIAKAKTDLKAGTVLDGPGYYTAYGICENSDIVQKENLLPMGLADRVKLKNNIPKDKEITFDDIEYDSNDLVFKLYKEQQQQF